jgi:hypothetical protein
MRILITGILLATLAGAQDKKAAPKMEHYDFHPLMEQIWEAWGNARSCERGEVLFQGCAARIFRHCSAEVHRMERVRCRGEKNVCRLLVGEIYAHGNVEDFSEAELCLGVGDRARNADEENRC